MTYFFSCLYLNPWIFINFAILLCYAHDFQHIEDLKKSIYTNERPYLCLLSVDWSSNIYADRTSNFIVSNNGTAVYVIIHTRNWPDEIANITFCLC